MAKRPPLPSLAIDQHVRYIDYQSLQFQSARFAQIFCVQGGFGGLRLWPVVHPRTWKKGGKINVSRLVLLSIEQRSIKKLWFLLLSIRLTRGSATAAFNLATLASLVQGFSLFTTRNVWEMNNIFFQKKKRGQKH